MRVTAILTLAALLACPEAHGQDGTSPADADDNVLSVIEESPFVSPRTHAMGGATVTVSDDLDAASGNPAGIGGLNWGKKSPPYTRKLYFPWIGIGANKNSAALYSDIRKSDEASGGALAKAVVDAHGGERQYARSTIALGTVFGRTMVIPFSDMQVAATSEGEGTDTIDVKYRNMSGVAYGFSAQDKDGRFTLGYFGYSATRQDSSGDFSYLAIVDKETRDAALADAAATRTGLAHNAGFIWRMGKAASPTLGVAMKDVGDTTFKGKDDDLVVEQDLTAGFSLSPTLGKNGLLHAVLQADRLMDDGVSFTKKYRFGLELNLDGHGSYATFAIRAGYNDAGPSGGIQLNVGLLALEATAFAVDIGAGNEKVVEQRFMSTMMVNVAEF